MIIGCTLGIRALCDPCSSASAAAVAPLAQRRREFYKTFRDIFIKRCCAGQTSAKINYRASMGRRSLNTTERAAQPILKYHILLNNQIELTSLLLQQQPAH